MMEFDFKKEIEESRFRKDLLEAILVSSMDEPLDKIFFPTEKEYILSEIINGAIAYIGGESGKITIQAFDPYKDYFGKSNYHYFEKALEDYFDVEMNGKEDALQPRIAKAFKAFVKTNIDISGPWSDRTIHNGLYDSYNLGASISVAALRYDLVIKARNKTLPSLEASERNDVVGIGKNMRMFIEDDLVIIKKSHSW